MKKILSFAFGIVEILVIIFAVFMVSILFLKNEYGYTQFGKDTLIIIDDLNTTELSHFQSGNLLVVQEVLYDNIAVGDELYYYDTITTEETKEYIVKTGIVKTKTGNNREALYTFEDGNGSSIASSRILGKYKNSYESAGKIISFLTSTGGFLVFVILPILLLFIYQVYRLIVILKYDKDE